LLAEEEREGPSALGRALLGNAPSDNGVVLSLVLQQMTRKRPATKAKAKGKGKKKKKLAGEAAPVSFSARDWLACSSVCTTWRRLSEEFIFKQVCSTHGWRPPRKPRRGRGGGGGEGGQWRRTYLEHACRFCSEVGEFPVRASGLVRNCAMKFLVCKHCVEANPRAHDALVSESLSIDLVSIYGRKLLKKERKRKRPNSTNANRATPSAPAATSSSSPIVIPDGDDEA